MLTIGFNDPDWHSGLDFQGKKFWEHLPFSDTDVHEWHVGVLRPFGLTTSLPANTPFNIRVEGTAERGVDYDLYQAYVFGAYPYDYYVISLVEGNTVMVPEPKAALHILAQPKEDYVWEGPEYIDLYLEDGEGYARKLLNDYNRSLLTQKYGGGRTIRCECTCACVAVTDESTNLAEGSADIEHTTPAGLKLIYRTDWATDPLFAGESLYPWSFSDGEPVAVEALVKLGTLVEVQAQFHLPFIGSPFNDGKPISAGERVLFGVVGDPGQFTDGVYDWNVDLIYSKAPGTGQTWFFPPLVTNPVQTVPVEGQLLYVDQRWSTFGAGWWLKGLSFLVGAGSPTMMVDGNGNRSALKFDSNSNEYIRSPGEQGFSTFVREDLGAPGVDDNDRYVQTDKHGNKSYFYTTVPSGGTFEDRYRLDYRVDANGNKTSYAYDAQNDYRLESATDQEGHVTTFSYGMTTGYLEKIVDFAGRETLVDIQSHQHSGIPGTPGQIGRLLSIAEADPGNGLPTKTIFEYEQDTLLMKLTKVTDVAGDGGDETIYLYDAAGRVGGVQHPDGSEESLVSFFGRIPIAYFTELEYPAFWGDLKRIGDILPPSRVDPNGNHNDFVLDELGLPLEEKTVRQGKPDVIVDYIRNPEGLITRITYPQPQYESEGVPDVRFEYDAKGNRLSQTWTDGSSRHWTYDPVLSQVTTFVDEVGRQTIFEIDSGTEQSPGTGNVLYVQQVIGTADNVQYQADGSVTGVVDDVVTSFLYTATPTGVGQVPGGLIKSMWDPDGKLTSYEYWDQDELNGTELVRFRLGQLKSIILPEAVGDAGPITLSFDYDKHGNLTDYTDQLDRKTQYAYDNLNRLTKITLPEPGTGQPSPLIRYEYDRRGRLSKITDPEENVTSYFYFYDTVANELRVTVQTPDHDQDSILTNTVFAFDALGLLKRVMDPLSRTRVQLALLAC